MHIHKSQAQTRRGFVLEYLCMMVYAPPLLFLGPRSTYQQQICMKNTVFFLKPEDHWNHDIKGLKIIYLHYF